MADERLAIDRLMAGWFFSHPRLGMRSVGVSFDQPQLKQFIQRVAEECARIAEKIAEQYSKQQGNQPSWGWRSEVAEAIREQFRLGGKP